MPRILHIIKSLGRGGAEMLLPETLKLHDRDKFSFHYAYFLPWKDQVVPLLRAGGAQVHCFQAHSNWQMLLQVPALIRYIQQHQIDQIHAHLPWAGFVAGIAGKKAGIPVYYTEHNNFARYHPLTRLVSTYSYRNYRKVFMVSGDAFTAAKHHFHDRFPCKVEALLNGVNTQQFQTNPEQGLAIRHSIGWSKDHIVIGIAAVYRSQKRLDRWLQIARKLLDRHPSVRFLLVGTGPLQKEVDHWIQEERLSDVVIQAGLQTELRPYYSAMDIFHMSSDFEGLPIALLEAMSMELVPVVSRSGGMPEVVDASCGYVYDKGNIDTAVDAMMELILDTCKMATKKQAARLKVIEQFDLHRMVYQLENAYLN